MRILRISRHFVAVAAAIVAIIAVVIVKKATFNAGKSGKKIAIFSQNCLHFLRRVILGFHIFQSTVNF